MCGWLSTLWYQASHETSAILFTIYMDNNIMVLPFGSSHVLPFTQLRSLLTTYSGASGIFHAIATPEFYTLLLACPVCLMFSFLGQHPFCHLPSPALLALFGRFLVNLACWCTPIPGIMQGRRQVCKSGGAGMLLSACIQIFGYSPLKIQCTAILLDRMNLKNWGGFSPPSPPLVYTLV